MNETTLLLYALFLQEPILNGGMNIAWKVKFGSLKADQSLRAVFMGYLNL